MEWFAAFAVCHLFAGLPIRIHTRATTAQLLDWTQRSGLSHEQHQRENIRLATYGLQPSPLSCSRQCVLLASGFNDIPDTGSNTTEFSICTAPTQRGIF